MSLLILLKKTFYFFGISLKTLLLLLTTTNAQILLLSLMSAIFVFLCMYVCLSGIKFCFVPAKKKLSLKLFKVK